MRRGIIIAVAMLGVLVVILAVALAKVGSDLDNERIGRRDLQLEADNLEQEVDSLSSERDTLQQQTEEHMKTIEQLKADLEHHRAQPQATSAQPNAQTPSASPAATP